MADINKLKDALIAADNAGDTEAAKMFADEIKSMQQPTMAQLMKQSGYGSVSEFDPYGGTFNKFALGVGKGLVDTGRGVGQRLGIVSESDIAKARELDKPLMKSTAAQVGNIAGSILPAILTAFIPGAQGYAGSTLIGAGLGALQPTTEDDSIVANTILGGAGGAVGKGVADVIGASISKGYTGAKTIAERLKNVIQTGQAPLAQKKLKLYCKL